MKKNFLFIFTLFCNFFFIANVKAYENTVCYNLNEKGCKVFSTCEWKLDDAGNSGYCTPKNYSSDYSKKYCKYSIKIYSGNENKSVTCNFWISSVSEDDLLIQYRDDYSTEETIRALGKRKDKYNYNSYYGTLNKNQSEFICFHKGVVFYNTNLDKPLNMESANKNGEYVAIYDFKKRWNELYKNTGECPKISFANAGTGSFYVYFTEQEENPPNVGITQDAQPSDKDDKADSDIDLGTVVTGCDVIPEVIRKWINNILNFVKYIALVLVIALGALDFMKAAGSGEPDGMKKAGQSFVKRLIAVVILFLLPVIVDFILNMINIYGVDPNNVDCL